MTSAPEWAPVGFEVVVVLEVELVVIVVVPMVTLLIVLLLPETSNTVPVTIIRHKTKAKYLNPDIFRSSSNLLNNPSDTNRMLTFIFVYEFK